MAIRLLSLSPVAWLTAEKITQQILWLVLFTILAPILGPKPYGVFSIVMVFVGFCEFVLGEVAVEALVTVDDLDLSHMATANMATGILAVAVSLVLCLLAPIIGMAFQDDEVKWLIWSLVPLPALSLLSAVPIALLRRSLQYQRLAVRSILGLVVGGLFGIALGVAGFGVWALALQVLAQRLAEVTIVWWSVPQRFRLGWSADHFREMRSVGLNMLAARAMIFAGGQLPRLILGYVLGPNALGLFTLANRFLDIIVNTALFPRVSIGRIELRVLEPGSVDFRSCFAEMVRDVALVNFPMLIGAALIMPELLRVWLDPRWQEGALAAQLTLLGGVSQVLFYSLDSALLAAKLSSVFRTMATVQAVTVVATVLCASPFGLDVTCLALAVRPGIVLMPFVVVFCQRCGMSIFEAMKPLFFPMLGSLVMAAALSLPVHRPEWFDGTPGMIGIVVIGAAVYAAFLFSFFRAPAIAAFVSFFAHRSGG